MGPAAEHICKNRRSGTNGRKRMKRHYAFYDYNTLERSSRFGARRASGREHQPRTLQLAFRVAF